MKTVLRIMLSLILCITTMFINPLSINKYTYAAQGLEFEVCPDQVTNSTITITAHPDNDEACHVTISWQSSWLTITPSEVTIAPGGSKDVEATINSRGLTPGRYNDKIVLESNCKPNYSEISVYLRVLNPIIHIDNPYQEWELPLFGNVDKQFTILNRLCDTTVSFHTDESPSGTVELSVPDSTSIEQGERLRIPVRVVTDGFDEPETRRIIIRAFDSEVGTVSLRLTPSRGETVVRVEDLGGSLGERFEGREVEVTSHLARSSPPIITDDLATCDDPDNPNMGVLRVEDPGGHLPRESHGDVIFGTFTGIYHDGSLRLTKPVERHFTSLMHYPQTLSAFSDWGKFPLQSNHFLFYLQADSNFQPTIHECITTESLKTISHLPFNRSHSCLFLPFKTPTVQTDDLYSGKCRKEYSIPAIEEALTSFDEPMRRVLRTGETPTLWIHLSGLWHSRNGQKCLLINGKSLSLETIKKHLLKLSILGPVVILLDCNTVEDLQHELCDIGNCRTVDCSCGDETRVCYPLSLSPAFYNDIVDRLTPKECKLEWDKLLQSIREDCPFIKGYKYSETLECNEVSREKSMNRKDIDIVRYRIKLIQRLTQRNNNDIEKKTEDITVFFTDFPIPRIEPSPLCPPVPLPLDFSDCPSGEAEESEPIDLEGIVREVNPDEGNFGVDSFFDVFMEIEIPERDMPVEVGDNVRITGTLQGETTVIPETIEVIEKECAIGISEIEPKIYCPTCFTWDYEEEAYAENQDLEYVLVNSGDIGASIGVSSKVDQIEGSLPITFKVTWSPTSFALPVGSTYKLNGKLEIHNVPELVPEIQIFLITTTFAISPEPCPKTITKTFRVTLCPTERTISGRVSFHNVKNKQCGIANATVRLYLRYEPECGHDRSFTVEMEALEGVHSSAKQDLPDYSLYLETKTDSQGYYRFHFIDKDCKHEYRVLVLFKNEYMNLTYQDCSNTFFVFSDIDGVQEPCRETTTERNMYIGKDTNLVFPADFTHDARSMAQIYCHMMESFGIFASLKCGDDPMLKSSMMPLKVCGYSEEDGTFYRYGEKINIDKKTSPINSNDRPYNREWHEFGHFLHDSLMGIPRRDGSDRNHAGFRNSNTKDSLAEGIAEFTSMLINRIIKNKVSCCDEYTLKNGLYWWDGGATDIENDNNLTAQNGQYGYYKPNGDFVAVNRNDTSIDNNGRLVDADGHVLCIRNSNEEFAVAAILLDLVDNAGWYDETTPNAVIHGTDDDGFFMPSWQDLYCLIKDKQPETMKDLYDSLQEKYRGNRNALQKINNMFVNQGFFQDSNNNGRRDAGENIGVTNKPVMRCPGRDVNGNWILVNRPAVSPRHDLPVVPGSCLKVHFLDAEGKPVPNELVNITVMSLDSPVYFTYQQTVEDDSLLYVYLPPNSNAMVRITLANGMGKVVLISTEKIWESVGQDKPFVAEVTFDAKEKSAHSVWHVKLQPEETVNVIQNTIRKGRFVYWNESSAIEECKVQVDKSWVHIPNPELNKTSGIIDFTIDAKNLPLGKNKVIVTHRQNGNIIDYLLCVNVLPAEKVITLTIGKQEATVNETSIQLDAPPFIQPPGRTMVPLRFISEAFGASIDYFPKTGNVTDVVLLFRCIDVHLHIGKTEAEIMNETTTLDAPPIIKQGRTYVPLRFISESFGAEIGWDGKTQKITITLKEVLSN